MPPSGTARTEFEMFEEMYDRIMDVNLKSTVFMCKRVLAGMKAKSYGRIINMTSVAAHNGGGPGSSVYAAVKQPYLRTPKVWLKK